MPVTPVRPPNGASTDPLEQLGKLSALFQAGLLTKDEFEAQKAKLLGM
ncbi:SHOCT domain-containing protein [Marisediminicola antarctica]